MSTSTSCPRVLLLSLVAVLSAASIGYAQSASFGRLSPDRFDVLPPSERVTGRPGTMSISQTACRTLPTAEVRRRVVDVAVQEWAFFGFSVVDSTSVSTTESDQPPTRRRRRRLDPVEAARLADSIAGYWAATSDGPWILERQNRAWNGPNGIASRWQYPWSAAFVSWVMCEGGLGRSSQFQRAVAHHVYIDQAIRARDAGTPQGAFVAYDVGDEAVEPGDLLCSARRPAYRSIAERRGQMGDGARTHCDVVVKVDSGRQQILAIGGNVRASVSLKLLPAVRGEDGLYPRVLSLGRRGLSAFAHLKLRAVSIDSDAFDSSPTIRALGCDARFRVPAQLAAVNLTIPRTASCAE